MVYQTLIPQPNDDLDVSVTDIQQNFLTANTVMDIDHYPFDNVTVNKGFHKTVTSPDQVTAPAASANAQFFGLQQTANLGTLQYSKRSITAYDANPIPSPITYIQSKAALVNISMAGIDIFDFTGITAGIFALKILSYSPIPVNNSYSVDVFWNGSTLAFPASFGVPSSVFIPSVAGSILSLGYIQILPAPANVDIMWTLVPYRLQ